MIWRFGDPTEAEQVGILVGEAMPDRFTVEAYDHSPKLVKAVMTGWMIAPGTWRMSRAGIKAKTFVFERSTGIDLTFALHQITTPKFERVGAASQPLVAPTSTLAASLELLPKTAKVGCR